MIIQELLLCALEHRPLDEHIASQILQRILEILRSGSPKGLPEPQKHE